MIELSFCLFLAIFIGIGLLSARKSKGNTADYLLAGSSVKPWLVALSAVATNNSGYMFIGMIGFTYTSGLSSIWLMIGWIFGDFVASMFIHKKLRMATGKRKLLSFGGAISFWHGEDLKKLRFFVGLITLIFLCVYAAAQFKAGSKALHVLFGWDYSTGAIIGSVMVFLYCMAGGIRASIWTDAAQSFVMIIAMAMLFFVGVDQVGGYSLFVTKLDALSPTYLNLFPEHLSATPGMTGALLFVLGWVFAGFGVVGQPHIMIRFMTMDNSENINKVRAYYYSWFSAFYLVTIGVGMLARLLLPANGKFDPELALPTLANNLLPEVLVGVVLAGLFSATMSTADSQILSCSAALTQDILPKNKSTYLITKLSTVIVTCIALGFALFGSSNVFELVLIAWSVLAACFGPILFLYSFNIKIKESVALAMLFAGFVVTIGWKALGWGEIIYEIAPGMIAPLVVYGIWYMIFSTQWDSEVEEASSNQS